MVLMAVVFIEAFRKWFQLSRVKQHEGRYGDLVLADVQE